MGDNVLDNILSSSSVKFDIIQKTRLVQVPAIPP